MKKLGLLMMLLLASMAGNAQERKYSTFYYQRATLFEELPVTSSDIIFLGNSITNGAEWAELFKNKHVKNRGISGDTSDRLLERLECNALNINPKNLVILIGTNDIGIGVPTEYTLKNIKEILQRTQTLCSNTAVKSSIRA